MRTKIIILKVLILVLFSCNSQVKKKENKKTILFNIIFADGFNSDEIVFTVNGSEITKSILLSDKSDGLTSLEYRIIKQGDKVILANVNGNENIISNGEKIILSVLLKEKQYDFQLNQDLGSYILIELINNEIIYTQKKDKPFFD